MKIAIYSRKSKFTGKGDSIGNQIELCKDYAERYFDDIEECYIYEDEGFSGGDTNRPKFQELMRDAQNKKFDVLLCYRLDRVSRNVADFSATTELLKKLDVDFISIKEQFEISTPMGRAMMNVASSFAQLERETISERIRDNMLQLAETGRWLGGNPPAGFETKAIEYIDAAGNERSYVNLGQVPEELEQVEYIYDKYLELRSINQVRKYTMVNNIRNYRGSFYSSSVLLAMLRHPIYVRANKDVIDYFDQQGCNVVGHAKINEKRGMLTYNKASRDGKLKDKSEWIVSVAEHEGNISANKWLKVQAQLDKNSITVPRTGTSKQALLSGLIRCKKCGAAMMVIYGQKRQDGYSRHYYLCNNKKYTGGKLCDANNVAGLDADLTVIHKLLELADSNQDLSDKIISLEEEDIRATNSDLLEGLEREEEKILEEINNLIKELSKSNAASKYILPQIEDRDLKLEEIKEEKLVLEETMYSNDISIMNQDLVISNINTFAEKFNELNNQQKKYYIQTIVNKVYWDDKTKHLDMELFGNSPESLQYCFGGRWTQNKNTIDFSVKLDQSLEHIGLPEDSVGNKIKKHRLLNLYTIQDVSDKTGLAYHHISFLERSLKEPTGKTLKKIAAALGVSVSYLKKRQ